VDRTNGNYTYAYDQYGNRWQQNGPHSMRLSFTGNNNRADGYSYDAAGNLATDNQGCTYGYGAEDRITGVGGGTCSSATYGYDAMGRRISKTTGGVTSYYLYDREGRPFVQASSATAWTRMELYAGTRHLGTYSGGTSGITYFDYADWLGTERARTTSTGAVYETCTSLPFGDGQTCTGSDVSPVHFTGKERDTESNLDNFGARYNSSGMGRFMSPDWSASPTGVPYANFSGPQSLNLYSYVQNNPTTNSDIDGHWCLFRTIGTTCQPPPTPPTPLPPPPPAMITPGTPQYNLASAQDSAMANPAFAPDNATNKTFCNLATCDVMGTLGGPMDALMGGKGAPNLANTDAMTLANSPDFHEVSPEEAQDMANEGIAVVAVQANPYGHGHIAAVRGELMPGLNESMGAGPTINNIGRTRDIGTAGQSFRSDQPVHYYAPNAP
jgi:RHS repeat-associated protein